MQEELSISEKDSAGSLHDRLMVLGAKLVFKTVEAITNGSVKTRKQEEPNTVKSANKLFKDTCAIDWNRSLQDIYNHIRGLSPYPTAWTILKNGEDSIPLKIYHTEKKEEGHSLANGTLIFDKKEIKVAVKDGFIKLLEIQLAGKRKMKTQEVLNGFSLEKNARVG